MPLERITRSMSGLDGVMELSFQRTCFHNRGVPYHVPLRLLGCTEGPPQGPGDEIEDAHQPLPLERIPAARSRRMPSRYTSPIPIRAPGIASRADVRRVAWRPGTTTRFR